MKSACTSSSMINESKSMNYFDSKFKIFWHPVCISHNVEDHPECPERVESILRTLREIFSIDHFIEASAASDDQIRMFHTSSHISRFKELCKNSEENSTIKRIDSDTIVMPYTRKGTSY